MDGKNRPRGDRVIGREIFVRPFYVYMVVNRGALRHNRPQRAGAAPNRLEGGGTGSSFIARQT